MSRALTAGETALARRVFGDAIRLDEVQVHEGGFGRFAVTLGSHLFMPPELAHSDFAAAGTSGQALFVHELVHVWQFQTRASWTLGSWAKTLALGGYGAGLPGYRYALPLPAFERLNLEQQASVVEHAFLLGAGMRTSSMPQAAKPCDYGCAPFPLRSSR